MGALAAVSMEAGDRASGTSLEIVVDASSTMRTPLADGRLRVDAVREVLTVYWCLLSEGDPELDVGLRLLGSMRTDTDAEACSDTGLAVPVRGVDRSELVRSTRELDASGSSPVGLALEQAAADLAATGGERMVVLLTDGWESCASDLEVVMTHLQVVDGIELQVVGLDLPDALEKQYSRLAPTTNATTTAELALALGQVAGGVVPWDGAAATLAVRAQRQGEPAEVATVSLVNVLDEQNVLLVAGEAGLGGEVPPGLYDAVIELADGDRLRFSGLVLGRGDDIDAVFDLGHAGEAKLDLVGSGVVAGDIVTVAVSGAPPGGTRVVLAPVGSPGRTVLDWAVVDGGSGEVQLITPDDGLELEARLHVAAPAGGSRIVAREAFTTEVVKPALELEREPEVGAGLEVVWTGPDNPRDYLTVVAPDAAEGEHGVRVATSVGSPLVLPVPSQPGRYQVRYVAGWSGRTLGKRGIRVRPVAARLVTPARVSAGEVFPVQWEGPGKLGDCLAVALPDTPEGEYLSLRQVADGNPLWLTAPDQDGSYEVRYISGDRTVARAALAVQGVPVILMVQETVEVGMRFEVTWTGPSGPGDFVTVVYAGAREGKFLDWTYTNVGSPLTLAAPDGPGACEVRYVRGADKATLASAELEVRMLP